MKKMKIILYFFIIQCLFISISGAQSLQDIGKLKNEYEKLKSIGGQNSTPEKKNINIDASQPSQIQISPFKMLQIEKDSLERINRFFGYNFFTNRDTISMYENLPPPKSYLLGPGDEIIITLWGETQLRQSFTVSRNGDIYDEKVGLLTLTGKTVEEAKEYLISQYGRVFSTLKSNNTSTYMDVSLGALKMINVNIVGEVKYPGVYPVHPFSNLITSLIQAGGIDTTGSLRAVKIKRDEKVFSQIDLYQYLINGSYPKDIQLRDNDVIVVPVRMNQISVDSGVVTPGIFEFIEGETIYDIISYAGGLTPKSSSTIDIKRITPLKLRYEKSQDQFNETYYIDYKNSKSVFPQNGDIISIRNIHETISYVEIIGQIKAPGKYNFYKGMTVIDLINLSSGFNDSTFWKSIYRQAQVIRRDPDKRYEKVIDFDVLKLKDGDISENITLHNLDKVVVHANLNFYEKKNVKIFGEVSIPGSYPLISDNESLGSLLERSGGLTSKALKNGISIFRDKGFFDDFSKQNEGNDDAEQLEKIRVAWKEKSITLMPGDSIVVKESTKTILVTGEVQNPGIVEFVKGKNLRYYINSAGGLSNRANRSSIILIEPNGIVKKNKWYFSPNVTDGSTIFIGEKEQSDPFDLTQFVTNWTQYSYKFFKYRP